MRIYRTTTVLALDVWPEKGKVFFEITPGIDGASKGQPKAGEKRFDYDKTIRIGFNVVDMLTSSFKLVQMAHGINNEIVKFADMSKVANSTSKDKKQLKVSLLEKGGVAINLSQGAEKANIVISQEEAYAVGKWLEFQAQKLILTTDVGKQQQADEE